MSSSTTKRIVKGTMSQKGIQPVVLPQHQAWIHRDFLKEKLRVRERYWHYWSDARSMSSRMDEETLWIIPDGLTWRKYLPLFTYWVEHIPVGRFVFLESAVECMDYRSTSPCLPVLVANDNGGGTITTMIPEATAIQERSKLKKLLEQYPNRVVSLCDLSVRVEEDDEWDMMGYHHMATLERCQHALLRASSMLVQQQQQSSKIVILTSEPQFFQKYQPDEGVDSMGIQRFLESLDHFASGMKNIPRTTLDDLQKRCDETYQIRNTPSLAASNKVGCGNLDYLSEEQVLIGLRNKTLVKGRLDVAKENPKEGYVTVNDGATTYFVDQTEGNFNRALHQDIVVLEPLDKEHWGRPVGRRRLVHHRDDDDDDNNNINEMDLSPPVPSARVVYIAEQSRRQYVATLVDLPMNDENACLVVPMDIRIPKIRIKTNAWRRFVGKRLLVQIDEWEIGNNYPAGHCLEIIGAVADLETEIQCLLYENQLHLDPFSPAALACLPPQGHDWVIPPEEIARRMDLRSTHRIFSVDPPGCQDIDDTMHARVLPSGDVEIGVHIADVTYFVPHNSALDVEAQIRGTTFYLVDRRFDMLPTLLSSDLCSLHGGMDRLAVSTIWTFSSDFKEIKSFWYGRTVIHNCQAMTYDQAHNILHDQAPDDPSKPPPPPLTAGYPVDMANVGSLKKDLTLLTLLARKLRHDREEYGGAVDLSSGDQGSELKFTLDSNNNPIKVTPKKQVEIHHTIAELMILANTWVAKTIHERMPDRALLRIHRSAEESRFEDLKEVLMVGKIDFDGSSNMALADSLKKAEKAAKSSSLMALFQSLATRAMSEAQYVSSGQVTGGNSLSHYGLGLQKYTHFTSPIRRYADVIVHKQLLAVDTEAKITTAKHTNNAGARLNSLPTSKVISILHGEGLERKESNDPWPSRQSENDPVLITPTTTLDEGEGDGTSTSITVYEPSQVSKICDGLNRQNRMAKISSFECQGLFLSLYFKEHFESTQAVVTSLRANGFWVYVPRFDMKGPVYLSDMNGNVQVDPALLKLPESAGVEPSGGFISSGRARSFPGGKCQLVESPEQRLEVTVPESKTNLVIRILDVVTVKILSDNWDARSRVPPPRLHLLASAPTNKPSSQKALVEERKVTGSAKATASMASSPGHDGPKQAKSPPPSLYSEILKIDTPPLLENVPLRSQKDKKAIQPKGVASMMGRVVFGEFRNPNTHSAKQEASMADAAAAAKERRGQIMEAQARNNEFNKARQIEKDATARMQRLAANKRNARRAKAK